VEVW